MVRRTLKTAGINQVYDFLYFFHSLPEFSLAKICYSRHPPFLCLTRAKAFPLCNCNILTPSRREQKDQREVFAVGLKDLPHSCNWPSLAISLSNFDPSKSDKKTTLINMRASWSSVAIGQRHSGQLTVSPAVFLHGCFFL